MDHNKYNVVSDRQILDLIDVKLIMDFCEKEKVCIFYPHISRYFYETYGDDIVIRIYFGVYKTKYDKYQDFDLLEKVFKNLITLEAVNNIKTVKHYKCKQIEFDIIERYYKTGICITMNISYDDKPDGWLAKVYHDLMSD